MKKQKPKKPGDAGGFFSRWFRRKEKTQARSSSEPSPWAVRLKVAFTILAWACVGAGICVGFIYLHRYISATGPAAAKYGPIELDGVPEWLEQNWIDTITATAGGTSFLLNDQTAQMIAERLDTLSWMDQVRVQATPSLLRVEAVYRKPAARVKIGTGRWVYLDEQGVVLDPLPLDSIHLVEIRGLPADQVPPPGGTCHADQAAAAAKLLKILERMDQKCCPDKPLLREIEYIDVSNFARQQSASKPHIIFVAKDGTPIYWGAAYGKSAMYFEAEETEKLTTLYNFYTQNGYTLLGKVKYIDLRTPLSQRPRPR